MAAFHLAVCVAFGVFISECAAGGGFRTTQIGPKPIWNETHLDRLKKDLLMNYDKFARPENHTEATEVKMGLSILHVETDEAKSTVIVHSWLKLQWTDSKLRWDESDYDRLSVIRIGDHEVWQPDIYLYNSAAFGEPLSRLGSRNVLVYPSGEVIWVPPIRLVALCDFNLRYWPFDTQRCYLQLGSWVYSDVEINLMLINNQSAGEVESIISGSSWELNITSERVTKSYPCCKETYSSVYFNLTLVRKSTPYCAIIVTPAVVATFLILLQFWLPPHAGEKIILNGFVVVILNMFLLYFGKQVCSVPSETPLIVLFYSSSLYIVTFSMLWSIISFTLCKIQKPRLPQLVKAVLQGKVGQWLLLSNYFMEVPSKAHTESIEEMKDHQLAEPEVETEKEQQLRASNQHDWMVLVVAIDRLTFALYCLLFIILAIAFL